ncbi:MAG: cation diffusion facilitator family transporter [Marinifilaceae bacterium]
MSIENKSQDHSHHHHSMNVDDMGKKFTITILLNVLITVSQLIGGYFSNSMALLSDALHNFSDVISLVISYIANKLSKKKCNEDKTFGYRRSEIIAAFINSSTLILIAIFLGKEAISRFSQPEPINSDIVIWMALASIIMNFISVMILKSGAKDNMNMKSAYLHLLSDVITSIAVLAGGLAMKYFNIFWLDSVLSILIAIYLFYVTWSLLMQSLKVLMQFVPNGINIKELSDKIVELEKVKNIHHVHIWQLDDKQIHFECHIDLEEDIKVSDFELIQKKVEHILEHKGINHVTLQPEFSVDDNKAMIV